MTEFKRVRHSVEKIDAVSLATGAARFTDDFELRDPLYLKILYSPHAHAEIVDLDPSEAEALDGVVAVFYYGNVPRVLHTTAGQGYPEPSPYDTVLFDRKVRFVGDRVAMVAAESPEIAEEALKRIRVTYRVLPAVFDMEEALKPDAPKLHTDDEFAKIPVPYDPSRNLAAEVEFSYGDPARGFAEADFVIEHEYRTPYMSHSALEPHAALAYLDEQGRLVIISSTQVPFHARRITAMVLGIPLRKIRVIKPRIGGGFGGKQEVLLEPLVGLATWRTGRPSRLVLSREEVLFATRTRHEMKIRLKTGVRRKDGAIVALEMDALMNAGAYGSHALTVLTNTGSKTLPLLNKIPHLRFHGRSVYTNLPVGGAYRGYGATQGYFALGQQVDIIARELGMDVLEFYKRWHIREGETSEVFKALGEGREGVEQVIHSCRLDECIDRGAEAIGWYEKRGKRHRPAPHRVRGVGMIAAMQGSAIPEIDMGSAYMKMNDDGSFNLHVGATDLGTGSDTVLAQIAAEVLDIPVDRIIVRSSDTDLTPFDVGAYASSTTYLSGEAVRKCALEIRRQILQVAAEMLQAPAERLSVEEGRAVDPATGQGVSYEEVALYSLYQRNQFQIQATASHIVHESPPPFIAQFAEVEVDLQTGEVAVVHFVSAVDCGTPINPRLVEGQVEGAVLDGITHTLFAEYRFDDKGRPLNLNFEDYKMPTFRDLPKITTIVVDSYEETGPFGAKSVAEIGINGPAPAIANAIYDAIGIRFFEIPITPEKVFRALKAHGILESTP